MQGYGPFLCPGRPLTTYNASLWTHYDHICSLVSTLDEIVLLRQFLKLEGVDMSSWTVLQSSEYEIIYMFIPETESGNYQKCIILLEKPNQTVGKSRIRLLP